MSAEAYAEQQFTAALTDRAFLGRLFLIDPGFDTDRPGSVVVVDSSTPVGEVLARCNGAGVLGTAVAVCDEDAPHGFALAQVRWVDK